LPATSFSYGGKLGSFPDVAKALMPAAQGVFLAVISSYRCQETAVRFSIMPERAAYRAPAVVEYFSANHIPENPHRSVLHGSGTEMLAIAFALDVLNDFRCARHVVTLIVNDLERLAHVQLGDTLQREVVQFVEDTVQITAIP
jgi:hypothetical protein